MTERCCVVLVTVPDSRTARLPARQARRLSLWLLKKRLAACVNQIPRVRSDYWWHGKIEHSRELLLIIKTTPAKVSSLIREVRRRHPYSVPEVLSLEVGKGNPDYLRWIAESVKEAS